MPTSRDLALLRAFETALSEGRLLDETIGTVLETALRFFDGVAVALLPAGGAPPMSRAGNTIVANAAEQRLGKVLETILSEGHEKRLLESGLAYLGATVKLNDQLRGAFGVCIPSSEAKGTDVEDGIRLEAEWVEKSITYLRSVS